MRTELKTLAICAASFEANVRKAAGVSPLLAPPLAMESFHPGSIEGYDLLYFKLHGLPAQPFWYGDGWITAISAGQLREADLTGAYVFAANCFLPDSPMLPALLDAGARAVIGGPGVNFSRASRLDGADLLGLWVRRGLQVGLSIDRSLDLAKARLRIGGKNKLRVDTLEFQVFS